MVDEFVRMKYFLCLLFRLGSTVANLATVLGKIDVARRGGAYKVIRKSFMFVLFRK